MTCYPRIWECPQASVDPRHIFWLFDLLNAARFRQALEIGCLNGASSTAFVEAINRGTLGYATFCDIDIRETLQDVLSQCRHPHQTATFTGRSADLLRQKTGFDFVFVDGDHRLETVREEVDLLLEQRPICVMAHDTSAQIIGLEGCGGLPYLKWRFQTAAPYLCLEDNAPRPGERTQRGMFLATTSTDVFEIARASLQRWGEPHLDLEADSHPTA
ncbi:MAG TPA: class I SAM-dependent methyltransferase [Planctomycetaceae bacterium]|nr:class I SAM-dependent methyltransferase [Planctomycetaceae bacterium]